MNSKFLKFTRCLSVLRKTYNSQCFSSRSYTTSYPPTLHYINSELRNSDRCHLCAEKQTITHLFVTCPNSQLFWTHFSVWWREKNNIEISLSEAQTLYGITDTVPQCLGLNLCLVIAKYYIYTSSKNEEDYFSTLFCLSLKIKYKLKLAKLRCKSGCKNNFLILANFLCFLASLFCLFVCYLFIYLFFVVFSVFTLR